MLSEHDTQSFEYSKACRSPRCCQLPGPQDDSISRKHDCTQNNTARACRTSASRAVSSMSQGTNVTPRSAGWLSWAASKLAALRLATVMSRSASFCSARASR